MGYVRCSCATGYRRILRHPATRKIEYSRRAGSVYAVKGCHSSAFFYGLGRIEYLAYQAVITNGTMYVAVFLLYVTRVWTPTFEGVMVLFSLGILVDSLLTFTFLLKVLYTGLERIGSGALSLA